MTDPFDVERKMVKCRNMPDCIRPDMDCHACLGSGCIPETDLQVFERVVRERDDALMDLNVALNTLELERNDD